MTHTILRVDTSARTENSQTRVLVDRLVDRLARQATRIIQRDVGQAPPPFLSEDWVNANFTPEEDRSAGQRKILELSDSLIDELEAADTLVIGLPIYNFGIPAALKAWIDLVARARKTFRYSEHGPEGLLTGKKAYVVVASGGTPSGSEIDFATPYIRHALGFIGINDVTIIAADQLMSQSEARMLRAEQAIDALVA